MELIVADCSAIYTGRGDTKLPRGIRSIIIKKDGSVSIHNDEGNKPLNYMKKAHFIKTTNAVGDEVWTFDTRHESLSITIYKILTTVNQNLMENDPGLERDGTENQLQEWLSCHTETLGDGFSLVQREYPTGNGPVDLLVFDSLETPVAVEVKRVAMLGAVDQCRRYVDALRENSTDENFKNTYGMIAALDIRPRTIEYAIKRDIKLVVIPESWRDSNSFSDNATQIDLNDTRLF